MSAAIQENKAYADTAHTLQACPFCGGKGEVVVCPYAGITYFKARCSGTTCFVKPETPLFIRKEQAMDVWNNRS